MEENNWFTEALVLEWLNALPQDAYQIAQHLRQAGIKGRPGIPTQCPIAKYLMRKAEEAGLVTKGLLFSVDLEIINICTPHPGLRVRIPAHVFNFVALFDAMADLDETNYRHETEKAQ